MKIYIITGERSGDLHASNLIKSLKRLQPNALFRGTGGAYMYEAGAVIFKTYQEMAFMGIWEVITNLRKISILFRECQNDIIQYKPDIVVLVDFSGFNMRMAKFLKRNGYKVYYYISPKVWAWNVKRVFKIKKYVDHLFCILPFEKTFFEKFNYHADYVGNPVVDAIRTFCPTPDFKHKYNIPIHKNIIAILPGSRIQEVKVMMQTMLDVCEAFPFYHFVIAGVSNLPMDIYNIKLPNNATCIMDCTFDILNISQAAIVTSGTASLETALFKVPHVVCYKTSPLTYYIGKCIIKVSYISLVNLIAGKLVVKELIQREFTSDNIKKELSLILNNIDYRSSILQGYDEVIHALGDTAASDNTASLILKYFKQEASVL